MPTDQMAKLPHRSGDLKGELVEFAWRSRWSKQLGKTLTEQFGEPITADEEDLSNAIDGFVLQHRLRLAARR